MPDTTADYAHRVRQQIDQYREVENIHALPGIFLYWAGRHLREPLAELFGTADPQQIFVNTFRECAGCATRPEFLSIGSGDCSLEVEIARRLRDTGMDFTIECAEISAVLLARGRAQAAARGVTECLRFTAVDINSWQPRQKYAAVMAHHSLHHIVALEHVFDCVHDVLRPGGRFVVSDIIGRNGHRRWPEALRLVEMIWETLPDSKKYNHQLKRLEREFVNWDCAQEGFEGVRAQDILPLLVERFDFEKFMAFGNLTDVFVDRSFGHNYDPDSPADRRFIDRLHEINELLLDLGVLKPTMLIAAMTPKGAGPELPSAYRNRLPAGCIRPAAADVTAAAGRATHDFPAGVATAAATGGPETAATECRPDDLVRELRRELGRMQELLDDTVGGRRRAEERIEALLASTSWRLTAPLRRLKTFLRGHR